MVVARESVMFRPAGGKGSVNWQDIILANWARLKGVRIGQQGHAGWALFVRRKDASFMFVIEHRGPGFPSVRFEFPYTGHHKFVNGRWQPENRGDVFEKAIAVYRRLSNQEQT